MTISTDSPDRLMTRDQLREFLNERGYCLGYSYFNKLCLPSRKAGPPIAKYWGKRPLYRVSDALAWAESRCSDAPGGSLDAA